MNAWVIGGGLAAATVCHELRGHGGAAHVFEKESEWGGLVRSRRLKGVIYEPHGSHIMHTDDAEVWRLVNDLIPFNGYQHTVRTMVRGKPLTWPIQADEVRREYGDDVVRGLVQLGDEAEMLDPGSISRLNFEQWCLAIMPREVYDDMVRPYTEKQWGRPASDLSADFAPKRVQVRHDGDRRLFKDRFQGYPDGRLEFGWEDLLRELFGHDADPTRMHTDVRCTLEGCLELLRSHPAPWRPDVVVLTVPLDDFCDDSMGALQWRGLSFEKKWVATSIDGLHQGCMVVNYPGKEFPWIRTHEAKAASGQRVSGSVVVTEFPGGPEKYYPVPGKGGADRKKNELYKEYVREKIEEMGPKVIFVGRLASFVYADTDEIIRQGIDAVRDFVRSGESIVA